MEKVYGIGELDYTSEPVCLREFLRDAMCQQFPCVREPLIYPKHIRDRKSKEELNRDSMMDMMGITITDSELLDLEQICSPDNLKIESAQLRLDVASIRKRPSFYSHTPIPKDSQLQTLKHLASRERIHERFLKHAGSIWVDKVLSMEEVKSHKGKDLSPGKELLTVVRLYLPFRHEVGVRNHRTSVASQEVVILGSQTLADLRDNFFCSSDHAICQDLSDEPFLKSSELAKDKYTSGMMFIENVFYNDKRSPSNINYSDVILKWAKEKNLKLGSTAAMEATKISDLTIKLGYPYLYQHQGNCEHLFCFTDVRLLHQSDPLKLSSYPLLRAISRRQSRYCMLCGQYIAKWITVGNARVPHDPCYFCQACFLSYNYKKKLKIGEFSAYPFFESIPEYN